MLDGITILNKTAITKIPEWAIGFLIVSAAAMILGVLLIKTRNNDTIGDVGAGITIIGFIVCIGIAWIQPEVETDRYRYEVTVGPYVRFTDIYEKYDVVERRGEIWVLEDKESED